MFGYFDAWMLGFCLHAGDSYPTQLGCLDAWMREFHLHSGDHCQSKVSGKQRLIVWHQLVYFSGFRKVVDREAP